MKPAAIICFDLDGTLLDHQGVIHPTDLHILQNNRQVCFIPATGRVLEGARQAFARNRVFPNQPLPLPLVTQNGTVTYRPGEILQGYFPFPAGVQERLLQICLDTPDLFTLFSTPDEMHMLWPTEFGMLEAAYYGLPYQPFRAASPGCVFSKSMCISDQPERLSQVVERTRALPVEQAYSMSTIMECTPQGTHKGTGLISLVASLGFEGVPLFAVGDGGNDLGMFGLVDRSFAPLDSPPEVLERVNQVIDPRPEGILTPILRWAGLAG